MNSLQAATIFLSLFTIFVFILYIYSVVQRIKQQQKLVEQQTFIERQEVLLNECWLKLTEISPNYPGLGSLRFRIKRYKVDKSYKELYHQVNDVLKDIRDCYDGPGVPNENYIKNRLNQHFNNQQS